MSFLESAGLFLLIATSLVGLLATLLGLPGQFLILLAALVYAAATGFATLGWKVLLLLVFLAAFAEALDFGLRAVGASRFGASRKGAWAAALGGVAGMFLFTPFLFGLGTVLEASSVVLPGSLPSKSFSSGESGPPCAPAWDLSPGRGRSSWQREHALVMIVVTLITFIHSGNHVETKIQDSGIRRGDHHRHPHCAVSAPSSCRPSSPSGSMKPTADRGTTSW